MSALSVTVMEEERQMILLALAILSLDRPGWEWTLGELAEKFAGREMFKSFRQLNADRWPDLTALRAAVAHWRSVETQHDQEVAKQAVLDAARAICEDKP